jgi:hypothetical protein
MPDFWKSSPYWQRAEEARARFQEAHAARERAGQDLLAKVATYGPQPSTLEYDARDRYLAAFQEAAAAFEVWHDAREAFEASPTGQAKARFHRDPLAAGEPATAKEVA